MIAVEFSTPGKLPECYPFVNTREMEGVLRVAGWSALQILELLRAHRVEFPDGTVASLGDEIALPGSVTHPGCRIREVAPAVYAQLLSANDRKFLWAMGISLAPDTRHAVEGVEVYCSADGRSVGA